MSGQYLEAHNAGPSGRQRRNTLGLEKKASPASPLVRSPLASPRARSPVGPQRRRQTTVTMSLERHDSDSLSPTRRQSARTFRTSPFAAYVTDNVKVVCRVRPFNARELALQDELSAAVIAKNQVAEPLRAVCEMTDRSVVFLDHQHGFAEKERFDFSGCFWSIPEEQQQQQEGTSVPFASQQSVFEFVGQPTLKKIWSGYNACVFAYGQTGAGKTYTMMGSEEAEGLTPRMCQSLFEQLAERRAATEGEESAFSDSVQSFSVDAQYLEIYQERVKDLLWAEGCRQQQEENGWDRENLRVRNEPGLGPFVVGLTTVRVESWEHCAHLLDMGRKYAHFGSTKMNEMSSRSHCIFRLILNQEERILPKKQFEKTRVFTKTSHINFVDLAGSERNKKSGAEGLRLKEASAINQSLTTLKNVIDALVEQKKVIPYRDSQLTWLLSESLGGNSCTYMMACISPHSDNADETLNTLRYALRTQGVVCRAKVNECSEAMYLARLRSDLRRTQELIETGVVAETEDLLNDVSEKKEKLSRMHSITRKQSLEASVLEGMLVEEKEKQKTIKFVNAFRITLYSRIADYHNQQHRMMYSELDQHTVAMEASVNVVQRMENKAEDLNDELQRLKKLLTRKIEEMEMQQQKVTAQLCWQRDSFRLEEVNRAELVSRWNSLRCTMWIEASNALYLQHQLNKSFEQQEQDASTEMNQLITASRAELRRIREAAEPGVRALEDEVAEAQSHIEKIRKQSRESYLQKNALISKYKETAAFVQCEMESNETETKASLERIQAQWKEKYQAERAMCIEKLTQLKHTLQQQCSHDVGTLREDHEVRARHASEMHERIEAEGNQLADSENVRLSANLAQLEHIWKGRVHCVTRHTLEMKNFINDFCDQEQAYMRPFEELSQIQRDGVADEDCQKVLQILRMPIDAVEWEASLHSATRTPSLLPKKMSLPFDPPPSQNLGSGVVKAIISPQMKPENGLGRASPRRRTPSPTVKPQWRLPGVSSLTASLAGTGTPRGTSSTPRNTVIKTGR